MANWTPEKATEIIRALLRQANAERNPNSGEPNHGAAEIIEEQANKIAAKYGLDISKIDAAFVSEVKIQNELGMTPVMNPLLRVNQRTDMRRLEFEELSKVVVEGYACRTKANDNGSVTFYGYDLDREISIFMFLSLLQISDDMRRIHMNEHKANVGKPAAKGLFSKAVKEFPKTWMGDEVFTDSFHLGFREAITDSYSRHEVDSAKKAAVETYYLNQTQFNRDYNAPILGIINEEIRELGKKVGNGIAKKARNAPSALTTTRLSPSTSNKVLDADITYLCLDDSGSMYGESIQQAKEGAKAHLKAALKNGRAVGLIKFGEGAKHLLAPQREMSERFIKAIDKLNANDGSTDMADAIKEAHARLINRKRKRTICIVTDGVPNNKAYTLEVAKLAKQDGVEIIAIGVEGADEAFLKQLASREGLGLLVDRSRLALIMGEMANA